MLRASDRRPKSNAGRRRVVAAGWLGESPLARKSLTPSREL